MAYWLKVLGPIIAAVVALGIAIFHGQLAKIFWRPRLKISIDINDPADCHKTTKKKFKITRDTTTIETAECYYFRLRVINEGNATAENVEVIVDSVKKMNQASRTFEVWKEFLPLNLTWAYTSDMFFPRISPNNLYKHCDLAYIIDPSRLQIIEENDTLITTGDYAGKKILILCSKYKPFTGTYILEPGTYKLEIVAAGSNAEPVRKTVDINFLNWYQEEKLMLKDGINIKVT